MKIYLLVLALIAPLAQAQDSTVLPCRMKNPDDPRPRIGLVLGGGGARGVAHISIIKELERLQIPIDCIAGTSMGSLVGGLYASGMTSSELQTMVETLDWKNILNDDIPRQERSLRRKEDDQLSLAPARPGVSKNGIKLPSGVLSGEKIIMFLTQKTSISAGTIDFNKLSIPFRAVATDIYSGKDVVLSSGNLAMSMRASMSIPGAFTPIEIDGHLLVDGGMVNQVPIDVARDMGADIIIAVDVGTPLEKIDAQSNILAIGNQVIGFLTVGNTERSVATLTEKDILIRPQLGDEVTTTSFDPDKIQLALKIGDEAAASAAPKLTQLSAPNVPVRVVTVSKDQHAVVSFITIENKSYYYDSIFENYLAELKGKPINYKHIERIFTEIYGQYPLDLITYEIENRDDKVGLIVTIEPKQTGRYAGEFGMTFNSNQNSQTQFDFTFGLLIAPFNPSGGELRALLTVGDEPELTGSWYQPISPGGKYFTRLIGGYTQNMYKFGSIFEVPVAEYVRNELFIAGGIGRAFSNWGETGIYINLADGNFEKRIGLQSFPEVSYRTRNLGFKFLVDTVDSLYLPRDGTLLNISYIESIESWGSSDSFRQFNLDYIGTYAFKENAVFGGVRFHQNDGTPELQNWFEVGGVTKFSGYQFNTVNVENYSLAFVGYNYRLGQLMGRNSVIGGTVEYGKIWGNTDVLDIEGYQTHGSVFLGFDSWLGLFMLGYGTSDEGASNWFIQLGHNQF